MSVPAPMLATPGPVPTGPQFFIEPKWDGARLICTHGEGGRTDLFSRHANNLSASFPDVRAACTETLAGRRVVLDGEVVVLDRLARPNFQLLQRRLHVTRPAKSPLTGCAATLFVFDVLMLDGQDVTALPYLQRRALLDDLGLEAAGPRLVKSPAWLDLDGAAALEIMDSLQLEGVVAKAVTSPYQPGRRSRHWIKTPIRRLWQLCHRGLRGFSQWPARGVIAARGWFRRRRRSHLLRADHFRPVRARPANPLHRTGGDTPTTLAVSDES
jgi:bifunctional non-homologous end joining protein LigD